MKIKELKDIPKNNTPKNCRLMGLDLGTKTIGVAVSDSMHSISTPVMTIERKKFSKDIEALSKIIKEFEIGGYILGLPLNMDGSEGGRCDATRSFADEMRQRPETFGNNPFIALYDERLSTSAVEDFLVNDVDMSRTKRKQVVDKLAAQIILQGALDYLGSNYE